MVDSVNDCNVHFDIQFGCLRYRRVCDHLRRFLGCGSAKLGQNLFDHLGWFDAGELLIQPLKREIESIVIEAQ